MITRLMSNLRNWGYRDSRLVDIKIGGMSDWRGKLGMVRRSHVEEKQ